MDHPRSRGVYRAAAWAVALPGRRPTILDIGAGTGLLSELVMEAYPGATVSLMDVSEKMIEVARKRFAGRECVRFVTADYRHEDLGGPFDAICSALSIHHLERDEKRALYGKVFSALKPGGIFVNADQVEGETPGLHRRNLAYWNDYVLQGPLDPGEIQAMFERRKTLDRMERLSVQMGWLEEIGFADVDVVYKNRSLAVFTGRVSR
ncbi:MAG: class I SAM-dependent methyltransferase [Methanomicrobiales archaeon]|nr:class I SAM-dependent methyltransferase [Methanomicrobiales archaeon]